MISLYIRFKLYKLSYHEEWGTYLEKKEIWCKNIIILDFWDESLSFWNVDVINFVNILLMETLDREKDKHFLTMSEI